MAGPTPATEVAAIAHLVRVAQRAPADDRERMPPQMFFFHTGRRTFERRLSPMCAFDVRGRLAGIWTTQLACPPNGGSIMIAGKEGKQRERERERSGFRCACLQHTTQSAWEENLHSRLWASGTCGKTPPCRKAPSRILLEGRMRTEVPSSAPC